MFYFLYLASFLVFSVIAHGERWSSDADLQKEFEKIEASLQEAVQGNSTWNIPYKCCMCKESLRLTRFLIMNEMQEKAEAICSLLLSARDQCLRKAKVYQDKITRSLFPGGPYTICKILKACK
ncbi:hypothetical protein HF521_021863 [Silurus meridionalis]|uniref:Saposin B-type domain-containing protein n=1 Tax=Silurus meridionalis TaxID=175797 RepID=A0A8T0BCI5_SILME|nr:hypothetical protein HF521_021863 [Silurus meridionalis]